ncbi:UDP-N-acetylmuramoyl-tripeptide--D-alanyl-D-alanine ligase [Paenibacillus albiflavus]|uniref:UDP-N-acetylmuramoyl-tripeptide--D-alanyl-D-alanine ligase n=1 Tax=Paenibacillus albiflavus TaxID=2545760 RepID=A0A4R4ENU0_9BACL|nr:UDP-N-acetylmuramoyl-tripeptide--D-alanyl-D-alanine ligase [Paenibacillus albiflavus]TCZ80211.1 UDP-N-acetylmuramoyl-tripeptide--D-alanyl-D-alanine ligase [Paenibacillus albiflavus]
MIKRSLKEIKKMANGFGLDQTYNSLSISGVSIDTRTLCNGNLFIPIIRIDNGHKYVEDAINKGAVASLWQKDQPNPPKGIPIIYVNNTLEALQNLAKAYRNQLNIKVIGVTGSNGKTTTKDMIYSIAATTYKTQKTIGNYNGEYGLPLTLLELEEDTQVAVLEMGMSNLGEIKLLSEIARPDIAIITMIGVSHIATLGSKEAIAKAKLEIIAGLHQSGTLIYYGDEPLLSKGVSGEPKTFRIIKFGESSVNDYYPIKQYVSNDGIHFTSNDSQDYLIPMFGTHNILNALASIAAGNELKIASKDIKNGLQNLTVTEMRMQQIKTKLGCTIINDAWNASPVSMKAAIQTITELTGYKRKILILGDMLELGANEIVYHQEIGNEINHDEINYVFTIGNLSEHISNQLYSKFTSSHVKHFQDKQELINHINNIIEENDLILIKGSRGIKLEEIVEKLI